MNRIYKKKNEHGVVLLTCLVFLLILLAMLRFAMTSARVEEQKAGIDLEILSARESAQSAMTFAEKFLVTQGQYFCLSQGVAEAQCEKERENFAASLFTMKERALATVNLSAVKQIDNIPFFMPTLNKGLYTGEFIKLQHNCSPFWACVDWTNAAYQVSRAAKDLGVNSHILESLECTTCNSGGAIRPRFIIERLLPEEIGMNGVTGAVFRITSVGFGRGAANSNLTNVMLQSDYILSL